MLKPAQLTMMPNFISTYPTNMRDPISVQTIYNAFEHALNNQNITEAAHAATSSRSTPLSQFFNWVLSLLDGGEHQNVAQKDVDAAKFLLLVDGHNMVHQLLHASTDSHGNLMEECHFKIGHNFILKQENEKLVIFDKSSPGVKMELTGVSFNQLKSTILLAYLKETGEPISDFNGEHDFRGVDFTGFKLTVDQLNMLSRCGASFAGATLSASEGDRIGTLDLSNASINKTMALQLIEAGADPERVLTRYLITQSKINKRQCEKEYGNTIAPIDIDGFDTSELDLTDIAGTDTHPQATGRRHINYRDVPVVIDQITDLAPKKAHQLHNRSEFSVADLVRHKGGEVRHLDLSDVSVNKTLALKLIEAGTDPVAVLAGYLHTQRKFNAIQFNCGNSKSSEAIDISGFDLSELDLTDIAFNAENVDGQMTQHILASDSDEMIEKITSLESDLP